MNIPDYYLEPANYETDLEDLRYVRTQVFIIEQQIPEAIEFDPLDPHCHHVIARDSQCQAIGTARLSPEGKIGRMAVLPAWRRQRVGASLLRMLLEKARSLGLASVTANAQIAAQGFYQNFGFVAEGETFAEAGIPHQAMRLELAPPVQAERHIHKPRPASVEAVRIDSLDAVLEATLHLIEHSRRQLYIYSRDLEYPLYGNNDIVEALKQFALRNRGDGVQIIVQEPGNLRNQNHPLLELAQRLPSHFSLRAPVENEDLQYPSAFVANDVDGYLFRLVGTRLEGHWSPNLPSRSRQLREEFERIWQRSRACSEFRALGL